MRIFRRILLAVVIPCGVLFAGGYWVAPIALSFYAAKTAPAAVNVVPTELNDRSVSQAAGLRLSYVGYDFEVPWSDLDQTQTKLYPQDSAEKNEAVLTFRSGLKVTIIAVPARQFVRDFSSDFNVGPHIVNTSFGRGGVASDYVVASNIYNFSPATMHYWSLSPQVHYREDVMLSMKSLLPGAAEHGIFNLQNAGYRGFQQGNPQVRQDTVLLNLYSDDGSVQIKLSQKDYRNPAGVTQAEINRVVQSLQRKIVFENPTAIAQK
ncbi:MAG TPA: hypothetical protein VH350_06495 [Candidatus Sulfotelmatobacter sp.]|jgi:hypothetical protein|nr:hypothetical protein [Candidatus Sulfotelmatobacter sp.]